MTRRFSASIALAAVTAAACLPAPATREGDLIVGLHLVANVMAAIVGVIVWGLLIWVVIRYRRRRPAEPGDLPRQIAGSNLLEAIWTAGPLIAVAILFALTLMTLNAIAAPQPGERVNLHIEAFRWGWHFEYPDDGVSVVSAGPASGPEAVLPVDQPVNVTLTSSDVVHAFFVPQFLTKVDAVPGRPNEFQLQIEEPGVYAGQCAEFCGLFHAYMPFTIRAVSADEYRTWLTEQRQLQLPMSDSPP